MESEKIHTFIAKIFFASKRASPDMAPGIEFLSSNVQNPMREYQTIMPHII
jgi:hypothetical protein